MEKNQKELMQNEKEKLLQEIQSLKQVIKYPTWRK